MFISSQHCDGYLQKEFLLSGVNELRVDIMNSGLFLLVLLIGLLVLSLLRSGESQHIADESCSVQILVPGLKGIFSLNLCDLKIIADCLLLTMHMLLSH